MSLFKIDNDSAHVKLPPPFILLLSILFGYFLHWIHPVEIIPETLKWPLGSILILTGVGVIGVSSRLFKKAHTHIEPWKTTSQIITTGVYKISRNPIYLSFVIIGMGVAFTANSLWIALMQILVVAWLQKFVIAKEEQYLESKFGEEYLKYKSNVRRWI